MTADLTQPALDFCRECLHWSQPADRPFGDQSTAPLGEPYIFDVYGKRGRFHFTDLSAVMAAVADYCERHGLRIHIEQNQPTLERWHVFTSSKADEHFSCTVHNDLCQALLSACVAAARKLKT